MHSVSLLISYFVLLEQTLYFHNAFYLPTYCKHQLTKLPNIPVWVEVSYYLNLEAGKGRLSEVSRLAKQASGKGRKDLCM